MQRLVADVCAGEQLSSKYIALPCTFGREFKPHARGRAGGKVFFWRHHHHRTEAEYAKTAKMVEGQ